MITSAWFIGKVKTLACEPSGKTTGTFSAAAEDGFGRKVPQGTNAVSYTHLTLPTNREV